MDGAKPWYLSRTIWASLATVLLAVAGMAGLPVEDVDMDLEGAALAEAVVQALTAVAGVFAILGRLKARARIV